MGKPETILFRCDEGTKGKIKEMAKEANMNFAEAMRIITKTAIKNWEIYKGSEKNV